MKTTISTLRKMYESSEKFAVLTCYDALFAEILENSGVDVLLVGDSLGNIIQGEKTTLSVTLDDMIYHTRCVARGAEKALVMADMPFGTSQLSPQHTFKNAGKLLAAGAQIVKIEGGRIMAETVDFLTQRGIPVCAHIGLTPQSVHQFGGYKLQGHSETTARQLIDDARILEESGAALLLMELVPATLAKQITEALHIPTIGIGAGRACSAQVLVLHDMLGLYQGKKLKFINNFMENACSIQEAVRNYVEAVKNNRFPDSEHEY